MGGALYGKYMRTSILISITVSQIGFVCGKLLRLYHGTELIDSAYTIFIAQNLQAFVLAVTDCKTFIPTKWMILAELALFLPLAMVRNLAKLSGTALIADAFILIGSESAV
jgi:proton-coupled amino acid transporter